MSVVKEELEPLLRVIVAEIGKGGARRAPARLRILQSRRVDRDDRRDRMRRRRYRPETIQ